ncbi:hypothetical protein MIR68_009544 [Amoeboaphelidium protococcarum]|nr:hypothetical protein MIR68_009544 [Amoeboaphelidium protococcarum]
MPTKEEQFLSACKLDLDLQNAQTSGLILEGQHVDAILTIDTGDGIKMLPQAYTNEQILAGIVDRLEIKVSTVIGEDVDFNLSWYQGSDSPRIGVTFWVNSADNKAASIEIGLIIKVPLKVKFGHCIDVLDDESITNEFNTKILVQILLKPKSVQLKNNQRFVSHLENPSVRRSLSLQVKVCRPYAIQCHRVGTSHLIVQLDAFFALQLLNVQVITCSGSCKSDNQQLLQLDARESWSLLFRNVLSNNEQVVCLRVDSRLDVDIVSYYTVRFGNNELVDITPVKDLNSILSSTSIQSSEIDHVTSLKVCLSSNRVIVDSDGYFSIELVVTNCTSDEITYMSVQILDDGSEFHGSSLSNNGRNAMDVWIDTPEFLLQWSEQMASNWQSTIVQCPTSLPCVRHFPVMNQMEPLSVSKSENSQLLQESYQYEYFEQIVSSSSKLKPLQNIPRLRKLREALLATAAKCLRRGIGHYQFHMQVYSVSVQSCIEALQMEESRQDAHLIEAELFKCLSHLVGPLLDNELVRRQQKQSESTQQLSFSALSVNDAATQFSQVKVLDWSCVWELNASNQICNNLLNSAPLTFISSYHQSYAPQLQNSSSQKMDTEINQCIMNCIELYIALREFNVVQIAANLDNLNPLTRQYVQYQMRNKLWQRQVLCFRRAFVRLQMDDLLAFLKGYGVDKSQVLEFLKLNKIQVSDDGDLVQFVVPRSTNK